MTFDYKHIILVVLIGALGTWFLIDHLNESGKVRTAELSAKDNLALYFACRTAKQHTDTIHSEKTVYDTVFYEVSPEVIKTSDTGCSSVYSDMFAYDRLKLWYKIGIKNCRITSLAFPKLIYPVDTIRECSIMDTCVNKPPEYVDLKRSRLGIWGGLAINNLREFPPLQAGIFWFYKNYGYIAPGFMFDVRTGRSYGIVTFGINLRK